jgi:hypothetical protein
MEILFLNIKKELLVIRLNTNSNKILFRLMLIIIILLEKKHIVAYLK